MAIDVTADTWEKEVLQSEAPAVLVDFWGPQCKPCLALAPHVEKLGEQYEGKLKVTKVDASQNRRLCIKLRVLGLPSMLFYKNGEEVKRLGGSDLTIEEIAEAASKIIE